MTGTPTPRRNPTKADRRLALALVAVPLAMLGVTFAAVPLYQMFCAATGYNGTPRRADGPSTKTVDRTISVRFDANVAPGLPWTFRPEQRKIELKLGENALAYFEARNLSDTTITGTASFNVTPESVGSYFNKIACFCFTEQTLKPGQRVDMPVSFFVDPALLDDKEAGRIEEITLSYTFFKVNGPANAKVGQQPSKSEASQTKISKPTENTGSSG